jgi:hypothetical protein
VLITLSWRYDRERSRASNIASGARVVTDLRKRPVFRHDFVLHNGETIIVPQREAKRVVDRRSDRAPAETCWEITLPSRLIRRVWADEIATWTVEDLEQPGDGGISTTVT